MMKKLPNNKEFERGLTIAMQYLTYQPRTIFETRTRLGKKNIDENIINDIIQYLENHRFLDDMNYAALFVEGKAKYKPRSRFAFSYELKQKGVSARIIDLVLEDYDDQQFAKKALQLKLNSWQNLDTEKFRKKAMNHLKYRGFSFETCLSAIDSFLEPSE